MTRIKKVFYNFTLISFSHSLMVFLGIFNVAILARFLGPYDYGRYNLFIFSAQLLSLFACTWILNPAAAKFFSEEHLKDNTLKKTFSAEAFLMLFNTAITGIVFYLIRDRVSGFLGLSNNLINIFVFVYLIVTAVFNLFYFGFQGSLNFKIYGAMPLIRSAMFIILLIAGLIFRKFFGLGFVIVAVIISYLATLIVILPKLKNFFPFVFDKKKILEILAFSWPVIFFSAGNFSLDWIDKYLIRSMVSVYAVGIYSAAWSLTTNFVIIPQQLYTIAMPLITAYRLENKQDNINFYLKKLIPQLALFFSLIIALLIVSAKVFVPLLYGQRYLDSVNIFILLALSSLFMGIKYFYNPISTVFNYIKLTGGVNISTAILCVLLNYLFIIKYGIIGAAVATALSSLLASTVVIFIINKKFDLINFRALYSTIPVILVAVVCLVSANLYINLLFALAVFYLAYLLVKKYRFFSAGDIEYLKKIEMPVWIKEPVFKFYRSFD